MSPRRVGEPSQDVSGTRQVRKVFTCHTVCSQDQRSGQRHYHKSVQRRSAIYRLLKMLVTTALPSQISLWINSNRSYWTLLGLGKTTQAFNFSVPNNIIISVTLGFREWVDGKLSKEFRQQNYWFQSVSMLVPSTPFGISFARLTVTWCISVSQLLLQYC